MELHRSVFWGILMIPGSLFYIVVLGKKMFQLHKRLNHLKAIERASLHLKKKLQRTTYQLNQEIKARASAEVLRQQSVDDLKLEVQQRGSIQTNLVQQRTLLRSFLDASPDLVYYRNEKHQFFGCNRAMELLTGKSESQLIGLTPEQIYNETVAKCVIETDQMVFQQNRAISYEQWLCYPDGRQTCFEIRKVPFYDRISKQRGLMGFGRDVTERKDYQLALEKASQDKTSFIATISHELRTPLNSIVGLSRMLLETSLDQKQHRYLKNIHLSAITLGNIFNDIIILDKIDHHSIQLIPTPLNLVEFLAELTDLVTLLIDQKRIKFKLKKDPSLPSHVLVDGTRLCQILWNLISNAVKFTPKGSITISVRMAYATCSSLIFEVKDSGIGICATEQSKIFDMYYQANGGVGHTNPGGSGIGLAISQHLARIMGGEITVQSKVGQGSCFILRITTPVVQSEQRIKSTDSPKTSHVLLVEDIELNVTVACTVLKKLGHTVDIAMSGAEALKLFKPHKYDLILLDIQLPDMNGFDVVATLSQRYQAKNLPPLIALTASSLQDKEKYLSKGINNVLSKPLSVSALESMISYCQNSLAANAITTSLFTETEERNCLYFNTDQLNQYLALFGPSFITDNVLLFNRTMPDYLAQLKTHITAQNEAAFWDQLHKVKSAVCTVGLKRLQTMVEKIEQTVPPKLWLQAEQWFDEFDRTWRHDVQQLNSWIEHQHNGY